MSGNTFQALMFLGSVAGYQVSRSLRSRSSGYMLRTPASTGNQRTWTWSGWIKRGKLSALQQLFGSADDNLSSGNSFGMRFNASDQIEVYGYQSTYTLQCNTAAIFRDPSAHMHVMLAIDTTQAVAADRCKLYVNGVQLSLTFTTNAALNQQFTVNLASKICGIGAAYNAPLASVSSLCDLHLSEIIFVDGLQLGPSDVTVTDVTTGALAPKSYTGTYGTNGFRLDFADNSAATAAAIGADRSGNGNNWTPTNVSVTAGVTNDSFVDTPTNYGIDTGAGGEVRGNYAVINPLSAPGLTVAEGGLKITTPTGPGHARATIAFPKTGKWFCEFTAFSAGTATDYLFAICSVETDPTSYGYTNTPSYGYSAFGERVVSNVFTAGFYPSYTTGDVIGCALDMDAGTLVWYKNGVAQTSISVVTGVEYVAIITDGSGARTTTVVFNAGQRPFAFAAPSGFKCLCTQNLPTPAVVKSNAYFNAVSFVSNGTTQNVNGFGHQPDFLWLKDRGTVDNHYVFDSVRGATQYIRTNTTGTESSGLLSAFISDGFSLAASQFVNGTNLIGYGLKKSILSGFDIVSYTGNGANRTVAHSLGVAPSLILIKDRSTSSYNWNVWHSAFSGTQYLNLDTTAAVATDATRWNSTVPSSSVFSLGTAAAVNTNASNFIAYLFSAVSGFSKFGIYTGNGSADGPFVYCGFKPRWIMFKRTDSTSSWLVIDTTRDTPNKNNNLYLAANTTAPEASLLEADYLSNGFKMRSTDLNVSSGTYIFAAFAEAPLNYARAL